MLSAGLVLCLAWGGRSASVTAADPRPASRSGTLGLELITPPAQRAIQSGLDYLAVRQSDNDGSFGSGSYRRNVGVTALSGMAFLASGSTPGRGKYGKAVNSAVSYLLNVTDAQGYIHVAESSSHGPMYEHGFATLFLAECYGMSPRPELRAKLKLAVGLIVKSQNKEGGWRYHPDRREADLSVTVCQIMALRAARNAGLYVPKPTVDECLKYIRQCQNADGGFKYQLQPGSISSFPRSAAGLVALYSAGVYEGKEIDRGLAYVMHYLPQGDLFRHDAHYYYGHYYAAQATWYAGGNYWKRWYPAIRDELLSRQLPDGSWADPPICTEYGTAMSLIILQLPNDYLPIFQR